MVGQLVRLLWEAEEQGEGRCGHVSFLHLPGSQACCHGMNAMMHSGMSRAG